MLVSWNWLKDYVSRPASPDEVATRLMMAGLNHESTEPVDDDYCIDLEITNNRPDCLGHIGIAREIAVLCDQPLKLPVPVPPQSARWSCAHLTSVAVERADLCPRYTARVIRGVKVGPSPAWLQARLRTLGVAVINNVVDITNYVLMECGQPLHAFDFGRLAGQCLTVRAARRGETFEAINHHTYTLDDSMCVIADSDRAVALAGVMGGAATEVCETTTDILIEAADFSQLATRSTARKLKLHSASSYRFERGVDPEGIDWASRRCCELILQCAGGELAEGSIDLGPQRAPLGPVTLRVPQVKRVLGITVPAAECVRILTALGCSLVTQESDTLTFAIPSWRRDLSREIDLIEEVARIHGYDQIPEDAAVPMAASTRSAADRVRSRVRQVMTAAGFDEAMTASVVSPELSSAFSPWTEAAPLTTNQPLLKGADCIRRSLVPSLLECRELNEARGNQPVELFETARIYLPQAEQLPREQVVLAATSGGDYFALKGVVETLLAMLNPGLKLAVEAVSLPLLEAGRSVRLHLNGELLGFLGALSAAGKQRFRLRSPATIVELDLAVLERAAVLVPQYAPASRHPAMTRDINLIVAESLRWAELEGAIAEAAGTSLESLRYRETYRDAQKDGPQKKRLLCSLLLRAADRTLTGEEADALRDRVVAACRTRFQAELVAG